MGRDELGGCSNVPVRFIDLALTHTLAHDPMAPAAAATPIGFGPTNGSPR